MNRFLILILLFFTLSAFAQTWVKHIQTNEDEEVRSAIETPTGGYLLSVAKGQFDENDPGRMKYRNTVYKMNAYGVITDSMAFNHSFWQYNVMGYFINNGNETFYWGMVISKLAPNPYLGYRFVRFGNDFQILHDTTIFFPGFTVGASIPNINSEGHIVATLSLIDNSTSLVSYYGKEWTTDGLPLRSQQYTQPVPTSEILEIPAINGYYIKDAATICKLDHNLNYIGRLYQHNSPVNPIAVTNMMNWKLINGARIVIAGQKSIPLQLINAGFGIFNDSVWESSVAYSKLLSSNYSMGMDFVDTNNMYCSAAMPSAAGEFGLSDNQMQLSNYTVGGKRNWDLLFDGLGYVMPTALVATKDTGCLWIGKYWDWHIKTSNDFDIIFIKLNKKGVMPNGIMPPLQKESFLVYPNPGTDVLCLNTDNKCSRFELIEPSGKIVINSTVNLDHTIINTKFLSPALYLYKAWDGNTLIKCGKWIKQ